jgi:hypothetical protein
MESVTAAFRAVFHDFDASGVVFSLSNSIVSRHTFSTDKYHLFPHSKTLFSATFN